MIESAVLPMTRRIFIHIGAHKTGTTSLQKLCFDNRDQLKDAGFLYPRSCTFQYAQHRLGFAAHQVTKPAVVDRPDLAVELAALVGEIAASDCPNVFISTEELFSAPAEGVNAIAAALAGDDVHIVAMIRRPDELFCSIYNQIAKRPDNNFRAHYSRFLAQPTRINLDMNFAACLGRWDAAFGRSKLRVLLYEDAPDASDLVLKAVGLPGTGVFSTRLADPMNVGLPVRVLELVRLSKLTPMSLDSRLKLFRVALARYATDQSVNESLLGPEERMNLLRAMDAITDETFEKYLGRDNVYRSSRFDPANFPPKTALTMVDLVALIGELL
jgi:hypothetical protein